MIEEEEESISKNVYFASIGLIGIPGIIDKVDVENPMPSVIREGTTKSCLEIIRAYILG